MAGGTVSAEVAIVGGGIVGCAAARELARDHDVVIIERDAVAGGATGRASGLVSIVQDYDDQPALARYAVDFFREYDGTGDFRLTPRPSVGLVTAGEEADERARARRLADAGFDVSFREPAALATDYPDAFHLDDFVGAVESREAGWVDPHTLAVTYRDEALAAGARVETGVTVESLLVEDGAVVGVDTTAGRVTADHVVVAAGWRTRDLVAPYLELPTRPFRYQTLNLDPGRPLGGDVPIAWEHEHYLYWRPEHNGDLHVGGGTYFVDEPGDVREGVTEEFRRLVADVIPRRVPGLEQARVKSGATCPTGDAATPDGYPIVDAPADGPAGLVVATGMHGFGIMASPVAGRAVRALVAADPAPFPMGPLALSRFADRSVNFESEYIVETPAAIPTPQG